MNKWKGNRIRSPRNAFGLIPGQILLRKSINHKWTNLKAVVLLGAFIAVLIGTVFSPSTPRIADIRASQASQAKPYAAFLTTPKSNRPVALVFSMTKLEVHIVKSMEEVPRDFAKSAVIVNDGLGNIVPQGADKGYIFLGRIDLEFGDLVDSDELKAKLTRKYSGTSTLDISYHAGHSEEMQPQLSDGARSTSEVRLLAKNGQYSLRKLPVKVIYIVGDIRQTNFPRRFGRSMLAFEEIYLDIKRNRDELFNNSRLLKLIERSHLSLKMQKMTNGVSKPVTTTRPKGSPP